MTTDEQPIRRVADSLREIGFLQTLWDVSIQTRRVTYDCHGSSESLREHMPDCGLLCAMRNLEMGVLLSALMSISRLSMQLDHTWPVRRRERARTLLARYRPLGAPKTYTPA